MCITVDMDMLGGKSLPWLTSAGTSSTSRTPVIDILASFRAALPNDVWRQTQHDSDNAVSRLTPFQTSSQVAVKLTQKWKQFYPA